MKLPLRKLKDVETYRLDLCQRKRRSFGGDEFIDRVKVIYKPTPVVGKWAEWDILYYLFGWLRKIETQDVETYTFTRIESPTEDPTVSEYEMQPSCEKLIKQLKRHVD